MFGEELTGHDYINHPLIELVGHSDFNQEVYSFVAEVIQMTTEQLETLLNSRRNNAE
jgi:hypothetical protein